MNSLALHVLEVQTLAYPKEVAVIKWEAPQEQHMIKIIIKSLIITLMAQSNYQLLFLENLHTENNYHLLKEKKSWKHLSLR